jgi:hypothetical protein
MASIRHFLPPFPEPEPSSDMPQLRQPPENLPPQAGDSARRCLWRRLSRSRMDHGSLLMCFPRESGSGRTPIFRPCIIRISIGCGCMTSADLEDDLF